MWNKTKVLRLWNTPNLHFGTGFVLLWTDFGVPHAEGKQSYKPNLQIFEGF